jgi:hypothetical protein
MDDEKARKLLPAWFIRRMMDDEWSFGLLLTTGHVMCISRITDFHAGIEGEWLDVEMLEHDNFWVRGLLEKGGKAITAPTSRLMASVRVSQIVAAFELADT